MKAKTTPATQFAKQFHLKKDDIFIAFQNPSYSLIEIPKKNGAMRKVYAPSPTLKKVQRNIGEWFSDFYKKYAPKNVMGFIKSDGISKKRDIVSNAKKHIKNDYLVNVDIEDFFPSCTPNMLFKILVQFMPITNEFIELITKICFLENSLPPGSPSSPVLSNIVLLPLDRKLEEYCKLKEITYTRYVDDLSFSSKKRITKAELKDLSSIITQHDFKINAEKTTFFKKNEIKEITGIAIEQGKMRLCEDTIDEIQNNISYYHQWKQKILKQYGAIPEVREKISKMQRSIKGQLNFAKRIDGANGKTFTKLRDKYENSIDERDFNFKLYI